MAGPCELIDFTVRVLGGNLVAPLEDSKNMSIGKSSFWVEEVGR